MKRMLMFLTVAACLLTALAVPARAAPYWVAYEGNDFPENEGWTRIFGAGGAQRSLEDGALVLDGRDDSVIYDAYKMTRPIDPEPGELFVMRTRLMVDELTAGHSDPAFAVTSDESWSVGFRLSETRIFNIDNLNMNADFEPGISHVFEVRSWDMRSSELRIDGNLALTGPFTPIISASRVTFGDQVEGAASLSRWDLVEFGVVPEPGSGALLGLGLIGRSFVR